MFYFLFYKYQIEDTIILNIVELNFAIWWIKFEYLLFVQNFAKLVFNSVEFNLIF